ncbi:hypothetical protein Poli38472_011965 [Pythium oligandrum]|uniref:Uncharacterized protein n=1 Tax=Pythium oligandrum TaxID=41045 RepID=A0A8K1CNR3_PYTOL|nr:hypothetical protein Poli38472_011965 [Pythium oligandrum]|eukprot:TMW66849.1 hypothetical protein Poli38472_011965 [Pythium oligandrum]
MRTVAVHPVDHEADPGDSRSLSARLDSISSSLAQPKAFQRFVSIITGFGRLYQRYSIAKLLEYEQYRRTVSRWRVVGILLMAPITGFLGALFPVWISLQEPRRGLFENHGFLVHYVIVVALAALGATLIPRAGLRFTNTQFSPTQVALIVFFVVLMTTCVFLGIATLWRFPVPFTLVVSFFPWSIFMAIGHFVVLKDLLAKSSPYRGPILSSWAWVIIQCSQIIIYPAFSALFEAITEIQQVILTFAFPVLKYIVKKALRFNGKAFGDFNEEMAVTGVEIAASLYQTMIMQNTPSLLATSIIIGVDILQGLLAVKVFMDKSSVVPHRDIIGLAIRHIEKAAVEEANLKEYTPRVVHRLTKASVTQPENGAPIVGPVIKSEVSDQQRGDVAVIQALEILQAAENILFVEYFEVAIPILNAVYLAIASQPGSARYNPKLAPFHASDDRLLDGLRGILVYSLLQGVTLLAMLVVMRFRYRLSTIRLLSFSLERHWWSLQGKMIGWLPLFLHFSLVHYGVDFHFKFDFGANDST